MNDQVDSDTQTLPDSRGFPSDPFAAWLGRLATGSMAIGLVGRLWAWLGGAGVATMVGCTAGMLAGLWLGNFFDWGGDLGGLRLETAKCIALAICSVAIFYIVRMYLPWTQLTLGRFHSWNSVPGPMYTVVPLAQIVLIKLAWLDMEREGVLLTMICADVAAAAAMLLASRL